MRVLVAPDSFSGTLTAPEAAAAVAAGWRSVVPGDDLELMPLSDGGPGFVEALAGSLGGRLSEAPTRDPLLRPAVGRVLLVGRTAYLESAHACGVDLLAPSERDPSRTTTAGVASLIRHALGLGAGRIVIGLGGSGTNDGGAGALDRLGMGLRAADGTPLSPGGVPLARLDHLKLSAGWRPAAELVAATDVDNPLLGPEGATATYGPQKGADAAQVALLEAALGRLVEVVTRDLPGSAGMELRPGAGAAGGLAYGLMLLGARRSSGIDLVLEAVSFDRRLSGADLVLTGEGSLDRQSLHGKVVAGVAAAARDAGVPCVVLAGRVVIDEREAAAAGISAAFSVSDEAGSPDAAPADARRQLEALSARVARQWTAL